MLGTPSRTPAVSDPNRLPSPTRGCATTVRGASSRAPGRRATGGRAPRAAPAPPSASGPGPVHVERPPLELAEADVVQLRDDEARDRAAGEREVGRLVDADELARHAEVDRLAGEELPEPPRLVAADLRQPARLSGVAADEPRGAELALAVAREDDRFHETNHPGGGCLASRFALMLGLYRPNRKGVYQCSLAVRSSCSLSSSSRSPPYRPRTRRSRGRTGGSSSRATARATRSPRSTRRRPTAATSSG